MLPFLKNKEAMVQQSAEDESLKRKPDDDDGSYEMLDAIAEDMMAAIEMKDKNHLKSALDALCSYLQDVDEEQDEKTIMDKE